MRTLRRITGNTLRDRIRNEDIRNIRELPKDGPESGDKREEIVQVGWMIRGLRR
jgi:hypothetical protein